MQTGWSLDACICSNSHCSVTQHCHLSLPALQQLKSLLCRGGSFSFRALRSHWNWKLPIGQTQCGSLFQWLPKLCKVVPGPWLLRVLFHLGLGPHFHRMECEPSTNKVHFSWCWKPWLPPKGMIISFTFARTSAVSVLNACSAGMCLP